MQEPQASEKDATARFVGPVKVELPGLAKFGVSLNRSTLSVPRSKK